MVPGPAHLLEHQGQHVGGEREPLGPGQQRLDGGVVEEAGQGGQRGLEPVAELRPVGHAPAGPHVQHRLPTARLVAQPGPAGGVGWLGGVGGVGGDEPPAPALGDQRHQVGEGLAEPGDDHVGPRGQDRQVEVGGVAGAEVDGAVMLSEALEGEALLVGLGVEMAQGQHHRVDQEGAGVAGQGDDLAAVGPSTVGSIGDVDRLGPVDHHLHPVGQRGQHVAVEPLEVGRLHPTGGERHAVDGGDLSRQVGRSQLGQGRPVDLTGPLQQGGTHPGRPVAPHGVVGEHRDVLGHRVHPQQRAEVGPPHPPGAGPLGIDQVDAQQPPAEDLAGAGHHPLEQ